MATVFREAGEGVVHRVLGMQHVYKATAADTGGRYAAWEIEVPAGAGAPPHRHEVDSESFYVLAGTLRVTDARGSRLVGAGEFVFLPPGGVHAFDNPTGVTARAFVVAAPGVEAERFFAGLDGREPAPDEVAALAARHGITLVPPAAA